MQHGMVIQLQYNGFMLNPIAHHLERYMDLLSTRQKVVASNIANADTPGYKTKDIDFQAALRSEMDRIAARPNDIESLPTKNDGNNVNLDRESRLLAENALRFQIASQLLRSQIRTVKSAIQEGKSA